MTDIGKREEQTAEDATVIEETPTDAPETGSEPESNEHRKSSWLSWLVLILIIGGLAAGWVLMPEKNRQQLTAFVTEQIDQLQPSQQQPSQQQQTEPASEAAPAPETINEPEPEATIPAPPPETAATLPREIPAELPAAAEQPAMTKPAEAKPQAATSKEVGTLMASIDNLTTELHAVRDEQRQLQQSMQAREKLELRANLHRIADSSSRLPQMAADWQDILLLPILSDAQRAQAESMRKLAADDAANIAAWRKQLEHLADSLPIPEHSDVIPKPDNTWLSWLAGQFHLRPAPTAERQALAALHYRLLNAGHALAAESLPDAKSWKALLDDTRTRLGKKVELGLPDSLDSVHEDKMKMRLLAQNWLEQL